MNSDYSKLMEYTRDTLALKHVSGLMYWDQEAMMPKGAAEQRAFCMGALSGQIQKREQNGKIRKWLGRIDESDLDEVGRAQVRMIRRTTARADRIPVRLARALAETTSRGFHAWSEARSKNDPSIFLPLLAEIVSLSREAGQALGDGSEPYDQLLDEYEPGMTVARLDEIFARLQPGLESLRDRLLGASPPPLPARGNFPESVQLELARELATRFGYSFSHGRLDLVTHPFCSGGGTDVRITTRIDERNPLDCLYSTIHEVGHATYEANIDREYSLTPLGSGVSMGVHESQSRLYENQLARGRPFTGWLHGRMHECFDASIADSPSQFYRAVNRLRKNHIRTEADEVQYNLHIILRYRLEKLLINDGLPVAELEGAWNEAFLKSFGFEVDSPANGFLQDVHWSAGLFGYFPTYSLGNIYAGCLYRSLRSEVDGLDGSLAEGDPEPATSWLRERLQRFGGLREPVETIENACGFDISEGPLLEYLEDKFAEIYRI